MTPKAVLNAAGRLRRFKALVSVTRDAVEETYGPATDDFPQCVARDEALLAAAWLAEHPADDGEPASRDFLRRLGRVIRDEATCLVVAASPLADADFTVRLIWEYRSPNGADRVYVAIDHPSVATAVPATNRGHVRRLLAALGIETKESHP